MDPFTYAQNLPLEMVSLESNNMIEETLYLMRSPKNYERIVSSMENVHKGKVKPHKLIEE